MKVNKEKQGAISFTEWFSLNLLVLFFETELTIMLSLFLSKSIKSMMQGIREQPTKQNNFEPE